MLKKYFQGATEKWHQWLPLVQLAINTMISERTKSSAFSLMFGRPFNGFEDYVNTVPGSTAGIEKCINQWMSFHNQVIPKIVKLSEAFKDVSRFKYDKSHKLVDKIKVGSKVMCIDQTRSSKWLPVYEGPFIISEINRGGAYILKDMNGDKLKAN
jgi:hypothetical protein